MSFMGDGSTTNLSLKNALQGIVASDWRGDVVAFKQEGWKNGGVGMPMDLGDLRHTLDFFSSWIGVTHLTIPGLDSDNHEAKSRSWALPWCTIGEPPIGRCEGVRIPTETDKARFGWAELARVLVPNLHRLFYEYPIVPDIGSKINIPLAFWREAREPLDPNAFPGRNPALYKPDFANNPDAASLMFNFTFTDKVGHNLSPTKIKNAMQHDKWGTVVVVRLDKKPLQPEHLEVLIAFCKSRVVPLMASVRGHLAPNAEFDPYFGLPIKKEYRRVDKATAEEVKAAVTEANFRDFFHTYREERKEVSSKWAAISSPYDV